MNGFSQILFDFRLRSFFLIALVLFAKTGVAEPTRLTYPNAFNLEIFGRGLMYGLGFDRVLSDDLAAGIALGSTSLKYPSGADADKNVMLLQVYLNYYFVHDQGSPFVTAGGNLVTDTGVAGLVSKSGNVTFSSSALMPTAGLGYEIRSDTGFLARVTAYAIAGDTVKPWFGITLGYCP